MINTLRRAAAHGALLATALFATAALAQTPSEAQRAAIKSQCRSDYIAHCSSIPPGGEASLQCLQKNMSSLSAGCKGAVQAVEAPAAPKAESAPAAPKAESAPAAPKTESAPAAAAAKPAARRTVRAAVGLRRRRPLALRRGRARRRPHRAVPGDPGGRDFAGLQGRAGPVRRAISRGRPALPGDRRLLAAAKGHDQ